MPSEYLGRPEARTATAVNSGWFVAIVILFNVLWHYAAGRGRLLARNHDAAAVARITGQYRFGPLL